MKVASQQNFHQLNEHNDAFLRDQWETRLKDLEYKLSRVKISQEFSKMELEKCKHAYLEEVKMRMSLESKLNT